MERVIKKALLLVLCFMLCLCTALFVACGGTTTDTSNNSGNGQQQEQTENTDVNNGTNGSQSGNEQSPEHTCSFVLEQAEEKYLKSDATCTEKAVYYKSCECGEKGEETFEYGTFVAHNYVDNVCEFCGKKQASEELEFALLANGTGYAVIGGWTDILVIPETYNDLPVTSIGSGAFYGCNVLTNIEIPDSVTNIGANAFDGCSSLQYNEYDNAKYLGNETNEYLWLIKAKSKDITSCTINENCKGIYHYAFSGCGSLTSIDIPNSVVSIGGSAFQNCSSMARVAIGNNVTSIEDYAFA